MSAVSQDDSHAPIEPPQNFFGRLRHVGPGIIVSGSIVGSGELIVTTKLGAEVGFALLWLILFSCFIKVFLQIELGRYVISSGDTVLEAFDRIPGPALPLGHHRVHWLNALWAVMAICSIIQLGGILTGLGLVFALPVLGLGAVPAWFWPAIFAVVTASLLALGRYRFVERASTLLVCLFTLSTVTAAVLVQGTSSAITTAELVEGLVPSIPPDGLLTAFAVLGITGVGASELVYYPYWCLEKGYARYVGPNDGTAAWTERAHGWIRVMQLDAWVACALYTTGTVAFYMLGAAVLHARGVVPEGDQMHETLSQIYTVGLGEELGTWCYSLGAVAVLFSTFFVAMASNGRVLADAVHVFGIKRLNDTGRKNLVRMLCILMPLICWAMVELIGKPVVLIMVGGVAQAAILPFIALAIVILRYRHTRQELVRRSWIDPVLWLAVVATGSIGIYQLWDKLS